MTEKLTALEVNALTGEEVIRELTADEIAEREQIDKAMKAELEVRADAKASALAKLAALGLTEEEIAAL
jgi:hypothetical protein